MFFWGGLIDYFNESFIVLSISVCINTSNPTFDTFSNGFNIILTGLIGIALVLGPIVIATSFFKALKSIPQQAKGVEEQREGGEEDFEDPSKKPNPLDKPNKKTKKRKINLKTNKKK